MAGTVGLTQFNRLKEDDMKRTFISMSLMIALGGCQPDAATKQPEPAAVVPAPAIVSEVVATAPVVVAEKTAKTAVKVAKPVQPMPIAASAPAAAVPVVVKPEAKSEAKVEVKEVKAEAVLSDAEGRKLAQQSNCFICHMIDKKLIGPSWKDIAAKYRGQPDAETRLIGKVAKGSSGVWGGSPMPPNAPRVNEVDIRALVRFILALN
ncbi:MAG TPA: c-type cytochrome [Sideroxyarcus sp.]|nr:c-type cytochrome [Sideroxyarcus sp.]